ncbi:hypothetical protein CpipJ_CPIJ012145 [Culex quinquefasciatus]|uniref:Uncharacterized protein n=1 Tax=Culex quinquefasciatus TaxID=7176 RepID=B0WZD7_CULQU|nr:hypothetical protein CpipJ_CPIJ012145 [Culex quinquefasciatus]|eukprot:XP_001862759.1 hypothetical protein CpipJ_CPIJ012145 [Culex quinquefasciatus]
MNPLLTILAGACLLLALSQQLIGTGAQEEVTPAAPTVAGESTTTKDAGDSSQEDKPKGGKGHGCFGRFTGGKVPGEMKGDQKKPMGPPNRYEFNKMEQSPGFGQMKPGQGEMQTGGHQALVGGFGGNQAAAMGAGTLRGPFVMVHPKKNKQQ